MTPADCSASRAQLYEDLVERDSQLKEEQRKNRMLRAELKRAQDTALSIKRKLAVRDAELASANAAKDRAKHDLQKEKQRRRELSKERTKKRQTTAPLSDTAVSDGAANEIDLDLSLEGDGLMKTRSNRVVSRDSSKEKKGQKKISNMTTSQYARQKRRAFAVGQQANKPSQRSKAKPQRPESGRQKSKGGSLHAMQADVDIANAAEQESFEECEDDEERKRRQRRERRLATLNAQVKRTQQQISSAHRKLFVHHHYREPHEQQNANNNKPAQVDADRDGPHEGDGADEGRAANDDEGNIRFVDLAGDDEYRVPSPSTQLFERLAASIAHGDSQGAMITKGSIRSMYQKLNLLRPCEEFLDEAAEVLNERARGMVADGSGPEVMVQEQSGRKR